MKFILKCVAILLCGAFLQSCASVRGTTTSFYVPEYRPGGTIAVIAADESVNQSLEFQLYKTKIEQRLAAAGYGIAPISSADQIALVAYGIDTGQTSAVSTPIFGQTGGGTSYHSGTVYGSGGSASYSGTSYSMPRYGVVGSYTGSQTTYGRAIAIDIVNMPKNKTEPVKSLYQGRVISRGSCGAIAEVFDEMLEIMFKNFPGVSGKSQTLEVRSEADC
jgi:hypothetical protein